MADCYFLGRVGYRRPKCGCSVWYPCFRCDVPKMLPTEMSATSDGSEPVPDCCSLRCYSTEHDQEVIQAFPKFFLIFNVHTRRNVY